LAAKIDTQGAEPFVIEGGQQTLSQASIIVLEFSPYHITRLGSDPQILFDFFSHFRLVGLASPEGDDLPDLVPFQDIFPLLTAAMGRGRKE
jgi:hypothetical protein